MRYEKTEEQGKKKNKREEAGKEGARKGADHHRGRSDQRPMTKLSEVAGWRQHIGG